MVVGSYKGTIHNTPADVTSTMSLTNIKHDGGKISGQLVLGPGLLGDGFFTGTVDIARRIQFTVPGVLSMGRFISLESSRLMVASKATTVAWTKPTIAILVLVVMATGTLNLRQQDKPHHH
jgi:hypothetical protein